MVNEAFITEFQTGNRAHLPELWGSVRFVASQANRRVRAAQTGGALCAVEVEDLIQEGFLAFLQAAEGKSHQAISAKENRALQRMRKRDTGGRLAVFACQF